jgi:AraC-like DNA-binding protein
LKLNNLYLLIIQGFILLLVSSCTTISSPEVDHSFAEAINVKHEVQDFDQIDFQPSENLDLGFYEGTVWVKLNITNGKEYESYIVMMNDLINRNYRFYKLDSLSNELKTVTKVEDLTKNDHRTFNNPKPNFKISLAPNEKATFFISTTSDGRILQATPSLMKVDEYQSIVHQNTLFNIIYYSAIGVLLLINLFHWSLLKRRIYYFYGFYIVSSCLFYLFVEGYLYGLGLTHHMVDHLMFVSIRIWIFSVVLFTSKFLEINLTHPKFYKFLNWTFFGLLGSTTLYQFVFFDSSISYLHKAENLFGFAWVVIVVIMIILSLKKRSQQAKYYMVAYSFLVAFVLLGLVDSHTTMLPGDPFSYFKIGTITEFAGFTYLIAFLIKGNIQKAAVLENELLQNRKELLELSKLLESKFATASLDLAIDAAVMENDTVEKSADTKSKVELSETELLEIESTILHELDLYAHHKSSDLSLSKLAELVNIPAYKLSITLNQKMDTTFYDLINSKRVEASLSLLRDNRNLTIEAITAEVGFKSKSTFYRAFKKFKGITPTDFLSKG